MNRKAIHKKYFAGLIIVLNLGFLYPFQAQDCTKLHCSKEFLGKFDYKSQSRSFQMSPGETRGIVVVFYANQVYRMVICSDPELGNVNYKIYNLRYHHEKNMLGIQQREVIKYQQAINGEYEYDETGNKIILGTEIINDTIWDRKFYEQKELAFDSGAYEFKAPYWETQTRKTERILIELTVDDKSNSREGPQFGCVNLLIGRKELKLNNLQ